MNNSIWFPNGSGSLANGEMCYDNSTRIDHKRGHQWFTDISEQEMYFNKKHAIEFINETPGPAFRDGSSLRGGSSSQSEGQRGDRPYGPKPVPSSFVSDNNMENKGFDNQFGNDSSICLSMSRAAEDHLFRNNGLRKVKVNEVAISGNCLPHPVVNNNKVMSSTFVRTDNNMCPGLTYNTADGNLMLTNQYYNGIDNNLLSIGQVYNKGSYDTSNTVVDHYGKGNSQFISVGPTTNSIKGHDNFFMADPSYNKVVNEPFMSYNKGDKSVAFCGKQDVGDTVPSTEENCSISSIVENSKKGEQTTTLSFGGFQGNPEERDLISSYDGVLNQSSDRLMGALGQKNSAGQQSASVISAATSKADGGKRNKEVKTKKRSSNNFPSNVKSLLSTGIFDGVPVKYVSWSREQNLRGVVKGTGYLCSCQDCKLSKAVNAYEFERHAGCRTKHPNNHIYFENGKTIYAVVQELKSTPHEMLFEVIQNVTGSSVNQKNFSTWKVSYQAATRELQRIYGKDDMVVAS